MWLSCVCVSVCEPGVERRAGGVQAGTGGLSGWWRAGGGLAGTLAMKEKAGVEVWAALRATSLVAWSKPRLGAGPSVSPRPPPRVEGPCCVPGRAVCV